MSRILPVRFQPALPVDRLILQDPPGAEAIEMDVLIVGAGPSGLACAIELARLVKKDQESGGGMPDLASMGGMPNMPKGMPRGGMPGMPGMKKMKKRPPGMRF